MWPQWILPMTDSPLEPDPVLCPQCHRELDGASLAAGLRFPCPHCQRVVRAEKTEAGVQTLVEYFTTICTECLEAQHVRAAYAGRLVVCIHCGQEFAALSEGAASELQAAPADQGEPPQNEISLDRERVEQLETSLQIERRANSATLEELLSVRRDRELMREELQVLTDKLAARENVVEEMAAMAKDLEQAHLELDRLQLDCQSAWEKLERLQAEKEEVETRLAQALAGEAVHSWQAHNPSSSRQEAGLEFRS
jgi:hypothetical protein